MNVPRSGERPMGQIVQDIIANVQEMMRSEVRLAKAELKEEGAKAAKAGRMLVVGAVLALFALGFFLLTAVYALTIFLDAWLAALIVAAVVAGAGAILILAGRKRIRSVNPTPQRTIESLKENAQWARDQAR